MSENNSFSKIVGEKEASALNILRDCGLSHITVPYFIENTTLHMAYGTHVEAGSLETERLYKECLKDLYSVKASAFTPRIYAFYGANLTPFPDEKYGAYLKRQIDTLQAKKTVNRYQIINAVFSYCEEALAHGFIKHGAALDSITSFSLLHGDLHYGNILKLKDVYKLIDFEYLMFGPPQVEIAFLLFWTYISGEEPFPSPTLLRERVSEICAVTGLNSTVAEQLEDVFFPVLLFLAADSLTKGKYADPIPFQKGLKSFYENILPEQ